MLKNRVAIITGSGRGIGKAAALLFAKEGAKIVVVDIDSKPAENTAKEIKEKGYKCICINGDMTNPDMAHEIVSKTIRKWGVIHIIINNAGYTWNSMFHKMTDEQWNSMLDIHMTAPFRLIRAAAPYYREAAKKEKAEGRIVNRKIINVSSLSGIRGMISQTNYSAAKAGLIGFSRALAKEWGSFNVQVNSVGFG